MRILPLVSPPPVYARKRSTMALTSFTVDMVLKRLIPNHHDTQKPCARPKGGGGCTREQASYPACRKDPPFSPRCPSSSTTSYKPLLFDTSCLVTYLLSLINSRISCSNFSSIILSLSREETDTVNHGWLCLVPPEQATLSARLHTSSPAMNYKTHSFSQSKLIARFFSV